MATSYQWQVPNGVFFISVAVLGAGGGGGGDCSSNANWPSGFIQSRFSGGAGGGGGGLSWANNLPVEPGDIIDITVGSGGTGGAFGSTVSSFGTAGSTTNPEFVNVNGFAGGSGQSSIVSKPGVWTITGGGGQGGSTTFGTRRDNGLNANPRYTYSYSNSTAGTGGSSSSDGRGGNGGSASELWSQDTVNTYAKRGGGGGGAGAWFGNPNGHQNGRGGGYQSDPTVGINGGGSGGQGGFGTSDFPTNGRNGNTLSWPYLGPSPGILAATGNATTPRGCGGGGAVRRSGVVASGGNGGDGLVRIMWNPPWDRDLRTYPTGGAQFS